MFGLAGAHRSGKTTTARAIADKMGIEFLETKVVDVFKDFGVDPKDEVPFALRLDIQDAILESLRIQYRLRTKPFVADRTPFDVLGYTQAEIGRTTVTSDLRDRVDAHWLNALMITKESLHSILLLPPLPNQIDAPGKAPACPLYMDHVYTLVKSLATQGGDYLGTVVIAESMSTDFNNRVEDGTSLFSHVQGIYAPETKLWTPNS